jgi:type IV pilus assembly protein PilP
MVAACSNEGDIRAWMQEKSKEIRPRVTPVPPAKPYKVVDYDVVGILNPFSADKLIPEGKGQKGTGGPDYEAREKRNNILEKVPLESIHVIGFMNINNQPMAVVEVTELQLVKQVKIGDWLGVDFGVITQINDQEVVVKEVVEDPSDPSGAWVERINALPLQVK